MRYRKDILSLDSALLLTRGNPAGFTANLGRLHPARGFFTGVTAGSQDELPLIGQVIYRLGSRSARLSFIAPGQICDSRELPDLLEGLAWQAGNWGAYHVLGELEEVCPAFEGMRRAGFSVYAWQRIWKMPVGQSDGSHAPDGYKLTDLAPVPKTEPKKHSGNGKNGAHAPGASSIWQTVREEDEFAVRSLFQNLVPPLAQSADPLAIRRQRGLVYRQANEIMAYVEGVFGPHGIYLYPLIHPDIDNAASLLKTLPEALMPLMGRPVYLAVRSYQAWMENTLIDLGATGSPRQALMVKHLTQAQRVPLNARLVQLENRQAEPAKSITQSVRHSE